MLIGFTSAEPSDLLGAFGRLQRSAAAVLRLAYPAAMAAEPLLDPKFPPADERPTSSLWRNGAFQRVWAAASVSIFGSLVTRVALPFVAIVNLHADSVGVALVRG